MSKQIQPGAFGPDILRLDPQQEIDRIVDFLQQEVQQRFHKGGAVVGISGGIDSSVVLAICSRAFGPDRVVGVMLPERESSPESATLAQMVADHYGIETITEDLTPALEGMGAYRRRDEAIRQIFPEYQPGWKAKIILPANLLDQQTLNVFRLVVVNPEGEESSQRLPARIFSQIVAASNFKQRLRMSMLYYHSELRNFAVVGTANKNEYDLGFFVKYGDGGADVSPISHLFKTQVYMLARRLDIPLEVQKRTPTTDTYPGGSTQEEFFYRIPFEILDTVWAGFEAGLPSDEIARCLNLSVAQVDRVIMDINSKQRATAYLRTPLLSLDEKNA